MRRKGIAPTIGALTDQGGVTTYLPAIDVAGKQWTMQTIRRDGFKLFEEDSRKERADTTSPLPSVVQAGPATAAAMARENPPAPRLWEVQTVVRQAEVRKGNAKAAELLEQSEAPEDLALAGRRGRSWHQCPSR